MTYCVGIKLNAGLVFLSDSRTNAGVDHISTFRKMIVYEQPGDRFMCLLSAGNLSISQSVREILQIEELRETDDGEPAHHHLERQEHVRRCARAGLGDAPRVRPRCRVAQARRAGFQRLASSSAARSRARACACSMVYSAGNFIEATTETPYFQVGESKYGKPVLDRVLTPDTPLDEAAKCALVSMDSTIKSNLSVGLPLDLVVYEANQLHTDKVVCIDAENPYFQMIHNNWGRKLREVFDSIESPVWNHAACAYPLKMPTGRHSALRKISTPEDKLI